MLSTEVYLVLLAATSLLHGSAAKLTEASFYGQSPPVYPTPKGDGVGDWATAYAKATAFVAQLTLEEKANLTFGVTTTTGCSGQIPAIERLGFPGLCLSDAGNGVRATDYVNGYPSGLHVGASWNKDLAHRRAIAMGGEFRTKGVNVMLGPVVGPLGRITEGGRNWEGFSNDPYLCGSLAFETVRGAQSVGVITSTKHFIGNEQDTNRNPIVDGNVTTQSVSSNIDDKTLHELYLWPFQDAIHAGSGNIMCSYNRINNSYACQNSKMLNGVLKGELGFQGFVVSDWFAQHSGVASANAGLDMAMPDGGVFWAGDNLVKAVNNGSVAESRLDDMATRIIATWYHLGQDAGYPELGVGMPAALNVPHPIVDARQASSRAILMEGAIEGHVLVKNVGSALPLKAPRLLSLYGYDGVAPRFNTPSVAAGPSIVDIFAADTWPLGYQSADIREAIGGFVGTPPIIPASQIAINGTIISGGGSGANAPAYISAPFDAIQAKAIEDGTSLFWDFESQAPYVAVDSDACLVFINAFASEGFDRPGIHDDYSDTLVMNVADKCKNTIVVIHNAGIRLVDQWIEHDNITAVVYAHVPGQDSGLALVQVLYGLSPFSGKLPYTVAKNESDYGSILSPTEPGDSLFPQSDFSEGVYTDYRAFDKNNITPRFEFGFGLSYTTFSFSDLQITQLTNVSTSRYPPAAPIIPGGIETLWDVVAHVTATVTNTGSVGGIEVAQLYVGIPGGPVRQLRGFDKVSVNVKSSTTVHFDLRRKDLSEWDVDAQQWALQAGSYMIYVGSSSRMLPLTSTLAIEN